MRTVRPARAVPPGDVLEVHAEALLHGRGRVRAAGGNVPAVNTNLHVTERQARVLLAAVRFTTLMRDAVTNTGAPASALPELHKLKGAETMLIAALERIRDKERTR